MCESDTCHLVAPSLVGECVMCVRVTLVILSSCYPDKICIVIFPSSLPFTPLSSSPHSFPPLPLPAPPPGKDVRCSFFCRMKCLSSKGRLGFYKTDSHKVRTTLGPAVAAFILLLWQLYSIISVKHSTACFIYAVGRL